MSSDSSDLDFGATLRGFAPGQQVLKRYTLVRMLGRGGMGVVWLARDNELERELALKFLPETIAHDRSAVDDLKREVRRAIDLAHPHIVKIHDFVTDGTVAAVAMEHVDGDTLSALRVARPGKVFSTDELRPWLEQLCGALDYAHQEARIVHRDLKPANLMVSRAGRLKVLDFGIAASISESASRVSNRGTSGTLAYMSPQQLLGKSPTPADDIYAIGATLYELLTGKPPFFRGDVTHQVLHDAPAPVSERRRELALDGAAAVPPAWDIVVRACLAKDPAQRPAGGAAVLALLNAPAAPPPLPVNSTRETPVPVLPPAESAPRATPPSAALPLPVPQSPAPKPARKRVRLGFVFAGLAIALLVVVPIAVWYVSFYLPAQDEQAVADFMAERQERLDREALAQAATRGNLAVTVTPAGAEVQVDGAAAVLAPVTIGDLAAGEHLVRVRLDGYETWEERVQVVAQKTTPLDVKLVPGKGSLLLLSEPAGASFALTGPSAEGGHTPALLSLDPGSYDIRVTEAGWRPKEQTVQVSRGGLKELKVALERERPPQLGGLWLVPQLGLEMIRVDAGEFDMGSPPDEPRRDSDEAPIHVVLTQPFWLGRTEVTMGQWKSIMGTDLKDVLRKAFNDDTLYFFGDKKQTFRDSAGATRDADPARWIANEGDDFPMVYVSWSDAMEFGRKITERERDAGRLPPGYVYTLPSEAQWEYACRAGTKTATYAGPITYKGDNHAPVLSAIAWYGGNSSVGYEGTGWDTKDWKDKESPGGFAGYRKVATKQPNPWGFYDMLGNVSEWTASSWTPQYQQGDNIDPLGEDGDGSRVQRGGAWHDTAPYVRSAQRVGLEPRRRTRAAGFRLALVPDPVAHRSAMERRGNAEFQTMMLALRLRAAALTPLNDPAPAVDRVFERTVSLNVLPVATGSSRFDAVTIETPAGAPASFVWAFVPPDNMRSWYIFPLEEIENQGFENFANVQKSALPGAEAMVPRSTPRLIAQALKAERLQPGKKYLIWFNFTDPVPVEFSVRSAFIAKPDATPEDAKAVLFRKASAP